MISFPSHLRVRDIEALVTNKRGRSYVPYKDWNNFQKTMFQLVQQHCQGHQKFTGPVLFEKVRIGRFRLALGIQPPGVMAPGPAPTAYTYEDVLSEAATFQPGGRARTTAN